MTMRMFRPDTGNAAVDAKRVQRLRKKAARLCACGCGREIPPEAHGKRTYFCQACKSRAQRERQKAEGVR